MNTVSAPAIVEFEVYLLMTMKLRISMSRKQAQLEAKLAEHELSVDDAERIHERIVEALGDEAAYFGNMKRLLGILDQDALSLEYSSVLWPGFDFKAVSGAGGLLESARYWHRTRNPSSVGSPIELPIWSMDVTEFIEKFGPMRRGRQWPLSDKFLPAYEEYEFPWGGESYGAGFSWGLFMFTAKSWPED
ncbi:hypothetical protein A5787_03910 [Mycobacterium sp. 852002-50816_SCH5313054-b]|uniref:hypothetical protein n=1 Tax=Mycobacterium sp. 852002-50816_SCH5313054-b TaxID=1834092 RepID=UPI0007FE2996|nr:hypothetical protein [Mycobacterium sp. 852002-50816_SCH5313054-b]OBF54897.1 hypothetical protein A5787_03910 [Mycobacterium sp. 852002-50816_SCH5313054-b]